MKRSRRCAPQKVDPDAIFFFADHSQHAGYLENIMLGAMLVDKVALEAQLGLCHSH